MSLTCPMCHFAGNPNSVTTCQNCGSALQASQFQTPPVLPSGQQSAQPNQLTGSVTWIEQTLEQVDFEWYRFLSQLILFIMALPLFATIFALSFALWIALAILGFRTLSHGLSPFNLISTVNSFGTLVAIVFPRVPRCSQMPAIRLTVKNSGGESAALVKGQMVSGTFRRGDDVQLLGEWKNGTLTVQSGVNKTLNTAITLRRNYWNIVFWILLGIVITTLIIVMAAY